MSRRGNCHDDAVAESFFNLLKRERIRRRAYKTRTEARRVKAKLREDRAEAGGPNDVWAMDFVHDQLATGRKIRVLTVVDTFSRYSPVLDPRFSYRGEDVVTRGKELKRLKVSGVRFHDLRGTGISFAYAHGVDIAQIAEISGHSKAECEAIIRRHYLAGSDVIEAIRKGTTEGLQEA